MMKFTKLTLLILVIVSQGFAQPLQDRSSVPTHLSISTHPTLGDYLTDADGKTLYIFLDDIDGSSHCYDACAAQWPPLLTPKPPTASDGLDETMLSVTLRNDGTQQVTYNGYPLYSFVGDMKAGDMKGQNWQDRWYVLSPKGYRLAQEVEGELTQ